MKRITTGVLFEATTGESRAVTKVGWRRDAGAIGKANKTMARSAPIVGRGIQSIARSGPLHMLQKTVLPR